VCTYTYVSPKIKTFADRQGKTLSSAAPETWVRFGLRTRPDATGVSAGRMVRRRTVSGTADRCTICSWHALVRVRLISHAPGRCTYVYVCVCPSQEKKERAVDPVQARPTYYGRKDRCSLGLETSSIPGTGHRPCGRRDEPTTTVERCIPRLSGRRPAGDKDHHLQITSIGIIRQEKAEKIRPTHLPPPRRSPMAASISSARNGRRRKRRQLRRRERVGGAPSRLHLAASGNILTAGDVHTSTRPGYAGASGIPFWSSGDFGAAYARHMPWPGTNRNGSSMPWRRGDDDGEVAVWLYGGDRCRISLKSYRASMVRVPAGPWRRAINSCRLVLLDEEEWQSYHGSSDHDVRVLARTHIHLFIQYNYKETRNNMFRKHKLKWSWG
jgi:hypothetical protein